MEQRLGNGKRLAHRFPVGAAQSACLWLSLRASGNEAKAERMHSSQAECGTNAARAGGQDKLLQPALGRVRWVLGVNILFRGGGQRRKEKAWRHNLLRIGHERAAVPGPCGPVLVCVCFPFFARAVVSVRLRVVRASKCGTSLWH